MFAGNNSRRIFKRSAIHGNRQVKHLSTWHNILQWYIQYESVWTQIVVKGHGIVDLQDMNEAEDTFAKYSSTLLHNLFVISFASD